MTTAPVISAAALLTEIRAISDYITAAEEIVTSGHMPDITTLQPRMADLCATLRESPQDIQQECFDEFSGLLGKLDSLAATMKAWDEKRT